MKFDEYAQSREGLLIFLNNFEKLEEAIDPNENLPRWQKRSGRFIQNPKFVSPEEKKPIGTGFEPYDPNSGRIFRDEKPKDVSYNPRDIEGNTYGEKKVSDFIETLYKIGEREGFSKLYSASEFIDKLTNMPEIKRMIPVLRNPYEYIAGLLNTAAKNRPEEIIVNNKNNTVELRDLSIQGKLPKRPSNQPGGDEALSNRELTNLGKFSKSEDDPRSYASPTILMSVSQIPHANLNQLKTELKKAAKTGAVSIAKKIVDEIKYRANNINPITSLPYDDKDEAETLYLKILDSDKFKVFA